MHTQQDLHVLRHLTSEREARLHDATPAEVRHRAGRPLRRWLGGLIVRLGTWVAAEPALGTAPAR